MLRRSICAVTEEFSGRSRSTSILPLNFVNFPCVVPRNWCTLKPIVEPDESNLYVSFAKRAGLRPAIKSAAIRLRCLIWNCSGFSPPSPAFSRAAYEKGAVGRINFPVQMPARLSIFSRRARRQSARVRFRNARPREVSDRLHRDNRKPCALAQTVPAPDDLALCKSQLAPQNTPPSACAGNCCESLQTDFSTQLQ